jgi:DNA-binding CsgD family transcriptional regulator
MDINTVMCHVPDKFVAARARLIEEDPAIPLIQAIPVGVAVRALDLFPGELFAQIPINQVLYPHFGLAHVTGICVQKERLGSYGGSMALYLFQEVGCRLPTWNECRMLEALCCDIQEAVVRMRLPFLPHQSILMQLFEEQHVGYMVLNRELRLLEANIRAIRIVEQYGSARAAQPRRTLLVDFVQELLGPQPSATNTTRVFYNAQGAKLIRATKHYLHKERHALREDVFILALRQVDYTVNQTGELMPEIRALSPRQREIANLLVGSGFSYKEIARELRLSEGTVRKHVENIYRIMEVVTRLELIRKLVRHDPW